MVKLTATLVISGDRLPRAGSERFEELRQALWDALDEITVWIDDETTEVAVECQGVGPAARELT